MLVIPFDHSIYLATLNFCFAVGSILHVFKTCIVLGILTIKVFVNCSNISVITSMIIAHYQLFYIKLIEMM